jgi:hypothetical protein
MNREDVLISDKEVRSNKGLKISSKESRLYKASPRREFACVLFRFTTVLQYSIGDLVDQLIYWFRIRLIPYILCSRDVRCLLLSSELIEVCPPCRLLRLFHDRRGVLWSLLDNLRFFATSRLC